MRRAPRLTGSWESGGRNPLVGALVLVLTIGTFYFLVQSIVLNAYVLVDSTTSTGASEALPTIESFYRRYQVVILLVLPATQFLILLLVPLAVATRWHTRDLPSYFRFDRLPVAGTVLAAAGVVLLLPVVDAVGEAMYSLFPGLERLSDATRPLVEAPTPPLLLLTLFSVALTPALCEETLFRGYLQRTLERRLPAPWHFVLSGLIFALFHQQLLSLPSLFLVGIYFGFLFWRLRSIYPGMLSHLTYNGLVIWISNLHPRAGSLINKNGSFQPWVVAVCAVGFMLIASAVWLFTRRRGMNSITKM